MEISEGGGYRVSATNNPTSIIPFLVVLEMDKVYMLDIIILSMEKRFEIKCYGRYGPGKEVLDTPISATMVMWAHKSGSDGPSYVDAYVECPYNTGGHGQRCKAAHPKVDKTGVGIGCPYSFNLPWASESIKDEEVKNQIKELIENPTPENLQKLKEIVPPELDKRPYQIIPY